MMQSCPERQTKKRERRRRWLPALTTQASALYNEGRYEAALTSLRRVIRKEPDHVGAMELLVRVQWALEDHEGVLETLRSLTSLNPYEPGYHFWRGAALQCLGRYGEAVKAYRTCGALGGEGSGLEPQELIKALEAWQSDLIAELLMDDPAFMAAYRQDPVQACRARGFDFSTGDIWQRRDAKHDQLTSWSRPS
jgi:tetratricopeptide (TPR) repeat protein